MRILSPGNSLVKAVIPVGYESNHSCYQRLTIPMAAVALGIPTTAGMDVPADIIVDMASGMTPRSRSTFEIRTEVHEVLTQESTKNTHSRVLGETSATTQTLASACLSVACRSLTWYYRRPSSRR